MAREALYNPLNLARPPVALRTFFPYLKSLARMMSVRITLSPAEIEKYGRPIVEGNKFQTPFGCAVW